jgi:streptomycin 6-kinase
MTGTVSASEAKQRSQADMRDARIQVPDAARRKALALGEAGVAWLAGLDGLVRDLAGEWALWIGRTLPGGSEAVVAEARTADGQEAVLKIAIPGLDPTASELRTLLAAQGRGYARVLRHDWARSAMLLERLGPQLAELGLPVDAQIEAICTTLLEAWAPAPDGVLFQTGAEKAKSLAGFIEATWRDLGKPCSERTIDMALRFAAIRGRAFDPATAVLAHGDAHAWNTLLVAGGGPRRFKFVDPDGLLIERAYDLGIPMREWGAELLAGDPAALGQQRCRLLARLTGVAPEPIWQWGFIERVSTGLLLAKLGLDRPAHDFLAVADAWAEAEASDPVRW